jgi:rhodanese-related sulfurtransferase
MKQLIIGGVIIVAGIAGLIALQSNKTTPAATTKTNSLSMATINSDVASGGQLIDVRTPAEYRQGHIKGSQNLPLQSIEANQLPGTNKDKPIYLYCRSGNRSAQAAALLKQAGYQNVIDLGAMSQVQSLGGTVTS